MSHYDTVFGSDEAAASACRNIMFGGLMQDKGNILVKRYRPVACPKWFSDKTGTAGPPVDAIKPTIPLRGACNDNIQCASQNCHQGKCDIGDLPTDASCEYSAQCSSKYCQGGKCDNKPFSKHVCHYNDYCASGGDVSFANIKNNCRTPKDYCNKCENVGEGNYSYVFQDNDPSETWDTVSRRYDGFQSNFKNQEVLCDSLDPNPCKRSFKQCGGQDNRSSKHPLPEWSEANGYDTSCPGECECKGDRYYKQCRP